MHLPAWHAHFGRGLPFVGKTAAVDPAAGNAACISFGGTAHSSPREMGEVAKTVSQKNALDFAEICGLVNHGSSISRQLPFMSGCRASILLAAHLMIRCFTAQV